MPEEPQPASRCFQFLVQQQVVDKIWGGDLHGRLKWRAEGEPL